MLGLRATCRGSQEPLLKRESLQVWNPPPLPLPLQGNGSAIIPIGRPHSRVMTRPLSMNRRAHPAGWIPQVAPFYLPTIEESPNGERILPVKPCPCSAAAQRP